MMAKGFDNMQIVIAENYKPIEFSTLFDSFVKNMY